MSTVIGLNLYTLRGLLAEPGRRAALLEQVAALGVEAVEPYGLATPARPREETLADARALREEAAAAGLAVPAVHSALPDPGEAGWFFEALGELGAGIAVVPSPEGLAGFTRERAFADPDSLARFAERLSALAEVASGAGARVGYHNHWWEWTALPGGRPSWDVLWEQADPRVVAEVDLYWAQAAGQDPASVVAALGERVELVHVKDGPATVDDPPQQVPPGRGDVALDAALRAGEATITTAIIEADHVAGGGDPLDYAAEGAAWLRARGGG
jgi:sugar phosphate isomerase/epimerase